jgi:biopolymer transport protein ExbB
MNQIALRDWLWATWDYLVQGGWVMLPMVTASVVMWALILERTRTYRRLGGQDIEAVEALAAAETNTLPSGVQGLRWTLVQRFLAVRSGLPQMDDLMLAHVTEKLRRSLHSRLAVIAVLAGVAPLLGLLGTVLGMIQTFEVISVFGTSNAKAMAGGISVALITTQTGLLVAIPGLFISGSLTRRASRLEHALDEFSLSLRRALKSGSGPPPDGSPLKAMEGTAS